MWLSNIHWFDLHTTLQTTVNQFGGLAITTGGLAILWDLRAKRDFMHEVLEKVRISSDVTAAGVDRVTMKWMDIPWDDLFRNSKHVSVFISYGSSWRKNNWQTIEKFAAVKGNSLRLFLPDPNDEPTMQILAQRYGYNSAKVRAAVLETTEEFARLGTSCAADVRIYYRVGDPTYTSYFFDEQVLVTLYANRRRRSNVPTLLLGPGTFCDFFKEDLAAIEHQSTPVALGNFQKVGSND